MVKVLLDTTIIVALITVFRVIFSSLIAPAILNWFDACREARQAEKQNQEEA